jgi:hypothetical protein
LVYRHRPLAQWRGLAHGIRITLSAGRFSLGAPTDITQSAQLP